MDPATPPPADDSFDLTTLDPDGARALAERVRRLGAGARSVEEVAGRITRYLHDHLVDSATGRRSCPLVRLFTTGLFATLGPALQARALATGGDPPGPTTLCLILMGTAGERPAWSTPGGSLHHQVIPLVSADLTRRFPMISRLLHDLGMPVAELARRSPDLVSSEEHACSVFFVARGRGSPFVPAQDDFVVPLGIESVLGFGGWLPSGDLFATVLFSRVSITRPTADLFELVAVGVRQAVGPCLDIAWR